MGHDLLEGDEHYGASGPILKGRDQYSVNPQKEVQALHTMLEGALDLFGKTKLGGYASALLGNANTLLGTTKQLKNPPIPTAHGAKLPENFIPNLIKTQKDAIEGIGTNAKALISFVNQLPAGLEKIKNELGKCLIGIKDCLDDISAAAKPNLGTINITVTAEPPELRLANHAAQLKAIIQDVNHKLGDPTRNLGAKLNESGFNPDTELLQIVSGVKEAITDYKPPTISQQVKTGSTQIGATATRVGIPGPHTPTTNTFSLPGIPGQKKPQT